MPLIGQAPNGKEAASRRLLFWTDARFFFWLFLAALLLITALIYAPGLKGGFLFDDYANLPNLGSMGPIDNWQAFWRYVTSGAADPTGRPVSLITFLLDAHDWPAEPWPFKRTNLLLHLLNGLLLAMLLRKLGKALPAAQEHPLRVNAAAVLGASMWLMHPLLVSTTLYIVQREAILPTTFTLLGLLSWLQARVAFRYGATVRGWIWAIFGFGLSTLLATLSKANGLLLPALMGAVEYFFLRNAAATPSSPTPSPGRHYRVALILLIIVPTLAIASFLLHEGWRGMAHGISSIRPWTLGQRLLTEPRVLVDYLKLLWFPHPYTTGLFNDQYRGSTSLWTPTSTWLAILAIAGLLVSAWMLRNKKPVLAVAIAFFFVGHAMESTTVALELYFEHRNYLPAMLLFWPLAQWLCGAPSKLSPSRTYPPPNEALALKIVLTLVILSGLAGMSYARADLWGNTRDQALLWAKINPHSPRAQAYAAQAEMQAGKPALAIARLAPALAHNPDQIQLALNLLAARCQQGNLTNIDIEQASTALRTTRDAGTLLSNWFGRAIDNAHSPACPEMTTATIGRLLEAAMENPLLMGTEGRRQDLYHLQGRLALVRDMPEEALASFNLALDQQVRISAALKQAAILGAAGHPAQGLAHLARYDAERSKEAKPEIGMPQIHAWILTRQNYWDRELVRLRQTLQDDAMRQRQPPHSV